MPSVCRRVLRQQHLRGELLQRPPRHTVRDLSRGHLLPRGLRFAGGSGVSSQPHERAGQRHPRRLPVRPWLLPFRPSVCSLRTGHVFHRLRDLPVRCVPGKFSAAVGATSGATCVECPASTYATESGTAACLECPQSTWQNESVPAERAWACTACPAHSSHGELGVTDVFTCECAAGFWKRPVSPGFACSECLPGHFCPGAYYLLDSDKSRGDHRFGTFRPMRTFFAFWRP
jgi:hypothetical protein